MTAVELKTGFNQAITSFKQANADCKLAVLEHAYCNLRHAIASPAPAALFSQVVNHLIRQFQQVRREDRPETLKEILVGAETRFGREYSTLNINMRLAFWYRLSQDMDPALVDAAKNCRKNSSTAQEIIELIDEMDLNQQMHFLRQVLSPGAAC
ncbi:orange carotenoid protein N-terminal domain-containing protein [Pseudanabaena sp. FACHB-2040]|uniref:orange carotenoid protein N-terminal domain-containing protein n=1 Tax=Pseudanabaena sp. FACHB-2040 TaxID=2692859 RepID=UPI0016830870|nr:orange carotenoid protein N-terminal domain-containing protein [Pseudanabaena sp. FACHB-2040]MBD2256385.1 hypothetical protein [Pseudanabaena sp. FACHB-2040]